MIDDDIIESTFTFDTYIGSTLNAVSCWFSKNLNATEDFSTTAISTFNLLKVVKYKLPVPALAHCHGCTTVVTDEVI